MINFNAIQQLERFDASQESKALQKNAERYLELKNDLWNENVSDCEQFQRRYSSFYGMNRILNKSRKRDYFTVMERLKDTERPIDVRLLTERLQPILGKYHFSFCSKMANIIDDNTYPIFDRNVDSVFHRVGIGKGLDYKTTIYQDIEDTYRFLKSHPVIDVFRQKFNAEGMGYMKVLDSILWVIGREKGRH